MKLSLTLASVFIGLCAHATPTPSPSPSPSPTPANLHCAASNDQPTNIHTFFEAFHAGENDFRIFPDTPAIVEECLSLGVDANTPTSLIKYFGGKPHTPLVTAILAGSYVCTTDDCVQSSVTIVTSLLNHKADPNLLDGVYTPLAAALLTFHDYAIPLIKTLLSAGANPNAPDKSGKLPIQSVIQARNQSNSAAVLNLLISSGSRTVDVAGGEGGNLLHSIGCPNNSGCLDAPFRSTPDPLKVSALISAGVDVNAKDSHGNTPLYYYAREANADSVMAVLNAGADPNLVTSDGMALLGSIFLPRKLTDGYGYQDYDSEMYLVIKLLLEKGVPVNQRFADQKTALIMATIHESPGGVLALLESGADVTEKDSAGKTALDYAKALKFYEIIDLLEKGSF